MIEVTLVDITQGAELVISDVAAICYASTKPGKPRLIQLMKKNHLACLRFASMAVNITGVSRACTHQLVRHANFGDMQESQRHVDASGFGYVVPDSISLDSESLKVYRDTMLVIQQAYVFLREKGVPKEDARFVLPNACASKIAKVANFQAWWMFLYGPAGRLQTTAQWEIREVAQQIESILAEHAPTIFGPSRQVPIPQ